MRFTIEDFSDFSTTIQASKLYEAYSARDVAIWDYCTSTELVTFIEKILIINQSQSEFPPLVINACLEILMCICIFPEYEDRKQFLIEKCVPIINRCNSFREREKDKVLKILSGL
jgi:hypothetical protein